MGALARLPVFLSLDGKRAVVAGGSPAAAWKAELLSASGARVEVYATDICDELQQLAADPPRGAIVINRCPWSADALKNADRKSTRLNSSHGLLSRMPSSA